MPHILVFDVNETLLDVHFLEPHFARLFGDGRALREWFSLVLLHSEAATLAGPYFDFAELGGAALDMIAARRGLQLRVEDREQILRGMRSLPAHEDAFEALRLLREGGRRMVALTNSGQGAAEDQLSNAGLAPFFERIFSVDAVRRYKPAPEPYRMVAAELGVPTSGLRMIAAHAWDILGAMQAGCAGAFVARPGKALFPLVPAPDIAGPDLLAVATQILKS